METRNPNRWRSWPSNLSALAAEKPILCRHLHSLAILLFLVTIYNDYLHGITSTLCPLCEEKCKEFHIALQGMHSRFWKHSHFLDLSLRNDISPYSVYGPLISRFLQKKKKKQDCFLLKFFFFSLSSFDTFPSSNHPSLKRIQTIYNHITALFCLHLKVLFKTNLCLYLCVCVCVKVA